LSKIKKYTKTFSSQRTGNLLNLLEIIEYKDLLYFMVKREFTILYKQTVLGISWAVIRPFFSMIIFSFIFGGLANIPSDGIPYPVFSYVAIVPWTYFSTAMTRSTQSLISNVGIFTKVYFPRLIIPLTPVIAGLIDFFIALTVVFFLMIYYSIIPTINIFWLPLLVLLMFMTSAGIGMWASSLAIQYRDIGFAMHFLTQILMYLAPVVWPVSLISEKFGDSARFFYGFYPMAGVIEGFRSSLLGHNPMPWDLIINGTFTTVIIFLSGAIYFNKKEPKFADVA